MCDTLPEAPDRPSTPPAQLRDAPPRASGGGGAAAVTVAQRKAKALLQQKLVTKKEAEDLLRADALFRFEEQMQEQGPTAPPNSPSLGPQSAIPPQPPPLPVGGAGMEGPWDSPPGPSDADSSWGSVDSSSNQAHARQIRSAQRAALKRRQNELRRNLTRQYERDSQMVHDTRAWERVLAQQNWLEARKSKHVAQLCSRGIPPAVRGRVWATMIGNPLMITQELYEITASRAREMSRRQQAAKEAQSQAAVADVEAQAQRQPGTGSGASEHRPSWGDLFEGKEKSMQLLDQDLPRTFPEYAFFHTSGMLREVLQTYVVFRPDMGYVQGMSYLASMLLLYLDDEFECFKAFANMLNQHFFFHFYQLERSTIEHHLRVFEHFFHATLPLLSNHFQRHSITPDMYYLEWCLTLYVKFLPLDVATRLWDSYLLHGEAFCIRAALGILKMHAAELGEMEFEGILQFVQRLPADLNQNALFEAIDSIQITPEKCQRVVKRITDPASGQPGCRPS